MARFCVPTPFIVACLALLCLFASLPVKAISLHQRPPSVLLVAEEEDDDPTANMSEDEYKNYLMNQ